ncbi:MAG: hypothetical protein ACOYJB_00655 [Christensenellaceae bacterium]
MKKEQKGLLAGFDEKIWESFTAGIEKYVSPIDLMEDDVWAALKQVVSAEDTEIVRWLQTRIPALAGDAPVDMLLITDGDKILKALILQMR